MNSKHFRMLLRLLVVGLGAGVGVTLVFTGLQVYRMTNEGTIPFELLILMYCGMGAIGALLGWCFSRRIVQSCIDGLRALESYMDALSLAQLAAMITGLGTGLLLAALLTQVLNYLGDSILTLAASATLYVVLGVAGLSIGMRRTDDFNDMLSSKQHRGDRRTVQPGAATVKVLDASALGDGRLEPVLKTGFVEGELLIPDFVLEELRLLADSPEEIRRIRGRRGLEAAERLQKTPGVSLRVEDTGDLSQQDADVRLMTLVKDQNAALMTGDFNLNRAARVIGLKVLNLNDLACAVRQATAAGDVLTVRVTKEGREPGQGVGYLEDGTMIVVEGGCGYVGETVQVTVTSVLQTSAGRMVFAKLNASGGPV